MIERGFYDQKRVNPTGLTLVITAHVAALGALALIKGPDILDPPTPLRTYPVAREREPEPEPEPQRRPANPLQERRSVMDRTEPVILRPTDDPIVHDPPDMPAIRDGDADTLPETRPEPIPPPPVRIAAEFDSRYAGDLQPPYPPAEQRAQREGSVRVRLTVGADGRVKAVARLSATSDAFWRATERHALARWRFRPATLDGRPVESSKTMNVFFRIEV